MTLDELRTHTKALLAARQEVTLPENEILIPLIHESMLNIANRYKVLGLMTKSENFRVLRSIKDNGEYYYIRMPKAPRLGTDPLDMDRELHMALANYAAAALSSRVENMKIFNSAAQKIVKDYSFKIKNTPAPEEIVS